MQEGYAQYDINTQSRSLVTGGGSYASNYDADVAAALDSAGINYTVMENGAIFAPGYGYALANGDQFLTNTGSQGSGDVRSVGDTSGEEAEYSGQIVVTGYSSSLAFMSVGAGAFMRWVLEELGSMAFGEAVDSATTDEEEAALEELDEKADQILEQQQAAREANVAELYDPQKAAAPVEYDMRDGGTLTGVRQGNVMFTDWDGNGSWDTAIARLSNGQYIWNTGNGWSPYTHFIGDPMR